MPKFSLLKTLALKPDLQPPSLENLERLRRIYDVSRDIVAWRLIKDLNIWASCFVQSKIMQKDEKARFERRPLPLKNKNVKELNFVKLSKSVDETNDLYPHFLKVLEKKNKDKSSTVEDIIRIRGHRFLLQSRIAKGNTIMSLISLISHHQCELLSPFL